MELAPIARTLWHRRALVLLVLVAAVAAMAAANSRSSGATVAGTALSRVLLDTPKSMLTHAGVVGSDVTGYRAALFADELSSTDAEREIARRAGISTDELVVRGVTAQPPLVVGQLATRSSIAAAAEAAPYVVQVTPETRMPIVNLSAYAPDREAAERLAGAATQTMAGLNVVPPGERSGAVVAPLGKAESATLVAGGSKKLVIVAGLFIVVGGCLAVIALDALLRWWRRLAALRVGPPPPVTGVRASAAFAADVLTSDVRRVRRRLPWPPRGRS